MTATVRSLLLAVALYYGVRDGIHLCGCTIAGVHR